MSESGQYQLLPSLSDAEYEALKTDIRARGIQVPVELDEQGLILDGHHRVRIWHELRAEGVKVPDYERIVRLNMSEQEKQHHVLALNLERRHLNAEQRRDLTLKLKALGWSNVRIADVEHVDEGTVRNDMKAGSEISEPAAPSPARVTGKDGKSYPAKRAAHTYARNKREAAKAVEKAQQGAMFKPGNNTPRDVREAKAPSSASAVVLAPLPASADVRIGDFRDFLTEIPAQSVDAIVTDPPYLAEFIASYSDLARLACRVVKPGGAVLVMSGQLHLPEVIRRLSEFLFYRWTICYETPGDHTIIHPSRIWSRWKPVLWMTVGSNSDTKYREDLVRSDREDKRFHEWGQSESGMAALIERCSDPGHLILDPFLGAGTTGVAALRLGRRFIGCDIDAEAVSNASTRLSEITT